MEQPSPAAPTEMAAPPSACAHYGRGCRVEAPCCGAWVGCRLCHNEQFPDHEIDRHAIRSMQCLTCNTIQPCARECSQCSAVMGDYFCGECNLFDNDGARKKIFHCDDCGICRVGGRENFYHCERCCGCYPHSLNNRHRCVDGSMHRECAICLERTFDSIQTVNVLACGHVLHHSCYREYVRYGNVVCPTCRTSLLSPQAQRQLQAADEALLNTIRDARATNEPVDGEALLNALRNPRVANADEGDEDEEEDDEGEDDDEEEDDSDMSDAASVETDDIVDFGDLTALRAVAWEAENDVEGLSESESDEAEDDARAQR